MRLPRACFARCLLVALSLAAMVTGIGRSRLAAETVFDEAFHGPEPTWRVRNTVHTRLLGQVRDNAGTANAPITAERIVLAVAAGYSALVEHGIGRVPVLDELTIEIALRVNSSGAQLAAEVVFPRSTDQKTGQPLRTLVYGERYAHPGTWRRLHLSQVPLLAERQARLLRVAPGQEVDVREAFVDRVVVVVPGGTRELILEIDELLVKGVAVDRPQATADGPLLQAASGDQVEVYDPVEVRRARDTLTIAGAPLVPRIVEYHGEAFAALAKLGFHGVWMHEPPTEAQLRAARQAEMWVICPPPDAAALTRIEPAGPWQTVLAWSLGFGRDGGTLDVVQAVAEDVRRQDPLQRPLIVHAVDRPRRYARLADVLVSPGGMMPLHGAKNDPRAADAPLPLLGCSPWTSLDLRWSPEATRQVRSLLPRATHAGWHEPREVYGAAMTAMTSGARGLLIRSDRRLDSSDPVASRMRQQLELLCNELALVEPWLVAGKRATGATISDPDITSTAWELGRTRLVYVAGAPRDRQSIPLAATTVETTLTVAGVPETATAHLLTTAGLIPLPGRRVTGGFQVPLGSLAASTFILLTDDLRSVAELKQRTAANAQAVAKSERELAVADLLRLESIHSQLASARTNAVAKHIDRGKQTVGECDLALARGDYPRVVQQARHLRRRVAELEQQLQRESLGDAPFQSVPTQYDLQLLPSHLALEQSLRSLPRGANLLAGGDFEDLGQVRSAGWKHATPLHSPFETTVELSPADPQHGSAALRLVARPAATALADDDSTTQPVVWVTSPPITARAGAVLEITGWARVTGAPGGLLVVDSLGGEQLGVRITNTRGWQPFRLLRTSDGQREVRLHLALDGPATAEVDAVMIREVIRPGEVALATGKPANQNTPPHSQTTAGPRR